MSSGISALSLRVLFWGHITLFSLVINDICECTQAEFLLLADVVNIFCEVASPRDAQLLESRLDGVVTWAMRWNLMLAIKCALMIFHRIKSPLVFEYSFDGATLRRTRMIKGLDVNFTPDRPEFN